MVYFYRFLHVDVVLLTITYRQAPVSALGLLVQFMFYFYHVFWPSIRSETNDVLSDDNGAGGLVLVPAMKFSLEHFVEHPPCTIITLTIEEMK